MLYELNLGCWNGVFALPTALIDKHLKLCGAQELKFILWFFRHGGESFDEAAISAGTGIPAAYLADSAAYWIQAGLIQKNEDHFAAATPAPPAPVATPAPAPQMPQHPAPAVVERRMLRPDGIYIAERMRQSPDLANLLHEAEGILGKTLSPSLSAVLLNAHDDYNLPPEVIIILLSYVRSVGKTSTAYIESLTRGWADDGVNSLAAAEHKLAELSEKNLAWKRILAATRIPHRSPSKKEEEEAHRWVYTLRFSSEMIAEAYDRCVDNTGKFSMRYMAKILEGWKNLGLTTPQALRAHEAQFKAQKETSAPTYDLSDFEKLNVFDILEK